MSSATAWTTVVLVALIAFGMKALGPVLFGPRSDGSGLPAPLARVVVLLAAPLLTALVVTSAFADGPRLAVGGDTLGVLAAGVLLLRGVGVLPAVVVAAVVAAGARLLGAA